MNNETVPDVQSRRVAAQLLTLTRRLFRPDDKLAAEMTLNQLRVCAILDEGPRPLSAISRELGISLSAMTQVADRLERAGMVRRVAEGTDRRMKRLQLTRRGEKLMRQRENARVDRVAAMLRQLSPRTRKEVQTILGTLVQASMATSAETNGVAEKVG